MILSIGINRWRNKLLFFKRITTPPSTILPKYKNTVKKVNVTPTVDVNFNIYLKVDISFIFPFNIFISSIKNISETKPINKLESTV